MSRPATISPQARETEPQTGGRGPSPPNRIELGGDDWKNNPPGRRGPQDRLKHYRLCVLVALISICVVFMGLTIAYVARQSGGNWRPVAIPPILWLNTVLLIFSSATIERARREVFREPLATEEWLGLGTPTRSASLPWLSITLMLGIGFLFGQYVAWRQLNDDGIFFATGPSGAFFFILTGAHAVHLIGGLVVLLWAAVANVFSRPLESRQIATDSGAWYWHAMGVLWLYIFALLLFVK